MVRCFVSSCFLAFALAMSFSCTPAADDGDGDDDDGGEDGEGEAEGEALSTQEVCEGTAQIVCTALQDCGCDPSLRSYDDVDDCISERSANCAAALPAELTSRLDAGGIIWVPALVDACTADLATFAASCRLVQTATCGTLFSDPAPLGGTYVAGNEEGPCAAVTGVCGTDLRCNPLPAVGEACEGRCQGGLSCVDGACAAPGDVGDACSEGGACLPTLSCRGGACGERVGVDEACDATEQCAAGLVCVDGACAAQPSRTEACRNETECGSLDACVRDPDARTCSEGGALGDACSFEAPCAADLRCIDATCATLPEIGDDCATTFECAAGATCDGAVCVAVPGPGETCASGLPRCAEGFGCNPTTNQCDTGGADGAPCHFTGTVDLCAPGLGCSFEPEGNVCRPKSAAGGACTNDNNCGVDDYCDFATLACTPRQAEGTACSAGNECATDLACQPGTGAASCRPLPTLGEACSFDCAGGTVCEGVGGICQPQLCVVG